MSKKPSKRYRAALQVADLKAKYEVPQAVDILKKMPSAKFDETVEISAFLGVDPKQSDQMVRGTVSLPNGSGKKIKVLAFTVVAAGAELPAALIATTLTTYSVPLVSPARVQVVAVTLQPSDDGMVVTR